MRVLSSILSVFDQLSYWIFDAFETFEMIFWVRNSSGGGHLTFLGVLAIVVLGFSVVFLIIGIVQRFLHFRG